MNGTLNHGAGAYLEYLRRMLDAAPKVSFELDGGVVRPLENLNTDAGSDWAIGLLSGWAVIADVLSLYRERIEEEGFLSTASELQSILYLAGEGGYRRRPGVGAATWLSLGVVNVKGQPGTVRVPRGANLVVQNIPKQGELPVVFEAQDEVEARVEWNALKPLIRTRPSIQVLNPGATQIRLAGVVTAIRPGSPLLMVAGAFRHFRIAEKVVANRAAGYTLVTWKEGLSQECMNQPPNSEIATGFVTAVCTFRQKGGLFGRKAAAWDTVSDAVKSQYGTRKGGVVGSADQAGTWKSIGGNLPAEDVRALAVDAAGNLFAASGGGIYKSAGPDWGSDWVVLPTTPARQDAHSLFLDDRGYLYAGSTRGAISFSTDQGESWQSLRAQLAPKVEHASWWVRLLEFLHLRKRPPASPEPSPPPALDGVVRAVASYNTAAGRYIFAGTDQGVFRMLEGGLEWEPFSDDLPGFNAGTGLAGTVVYGLGFNTGLLFAATSAGLFSRKAADKGWKKEKFPGGGQPVAYTFLQQNGTRFVGTAAGIFRSSSKGGWQAAGNGLPQPCAIRALAVSAGTLNYLIAATDRGVYRSSDLGDNWAAVNKQELALFGVQDLFSEALNRRDFPKLLGQLFARNGAAVPPDVSVQPATDGLSWQVSQFSIRKQGDRLQVSTRTDLTSMDILAVAADAAGHVFAASPCGGFIETDWPNFSIQGNCIDLDRVFGGIEAQSLVVLEQGAPEALWASYSVTAAEPLPTSAYGKQATVTRIRTVNDGRLGLFDLRTTTVYLQTAELQPFIAQVPIFQMMSGSRVELSGCVAGLCPGKAIAIVGLRPSAVLPELGGIFAMSDDRVTAEGLAEQDVCALASEGGTIYAGTAGSGVFRRTAGEAWQAINTDLSNLDVRALAVSPFGVYAGTNGGGVFRLFTTGWKPYSPGLTSTRVRTLAMDSAGALYAGTPDAGVFRRVLGAAQWESLAAGLAASDVRALMVDPQDAVYAGTSGGVFRLDPGEPRWKIVSTGMEALDVLSLAADRGGALYAGTSGGGVFRLAGFNGSCECLQPHAIEHPVRALALDPTGGLYAAARGHGVLKWSIEEGWTPLLPGVSNDPGALLFDSQERLLAGCGNSAYLADEAGRLTGVAHRFLFAVPGDVAVELDQGTISGALRAAFSGAAIVLPAEVAVTVFRRGSVWVLRVANRTYLIRVRDAEADVYETPRLQALAFSVAAQSEIWTLKDAAGQGRLTAQPGEVLADSAAGDSDSVSEVATLEAAVVSETENATICMLRAPLANVYDPAGTALCANLAYATQGETVPVEVLGGGNASQSNQTFTLGRPPLTYTHNRGDAGIRSTLNVSVQASISQSLRLPSTMAPPASTGEPWAEVSSLYRAGPDAAVYALSTDSRGAVTLRFGDGIHGARLPTGRENVSAEYRTGAGSQGNMGPDSLTVFRKRPLGLRSVSNPVPAAGGMDPEPLECIRQRFPVTLKSLGRIVSLADYQDFASAFEGVVKAQACALLDGRERVVHLTAAIAGGLPIEQSPSIAEALAAAIERSRAGRDRLSIAGFDQAFFNLAATISVAPGSDPLKVESAVRDAIVQAFSFNRRAFGQDVWASEIVAAMQRVPGIRSVRVESLYRRGFAMRNAEVLTAARARWDPARQRIERAEMLLVNIGGVQLQAGAET
ncbi:MAG TPA: baseplate J/gp47 family protein [Bryobacteraceae bacterium]|nr:baseplate J/gp47 family protein [Bryobacteraceae bacterium]